MSAVAHGVLGLLPGFLTAKVLHGMGLLRIPATVELAGLDVAAEIDAELHTSELGKAEQSAAHAVASTAQEVSR